MIMRNEPFTPKEVIEGRMKWPNILFEYGLTLTEKQSIDFLMDNTSYSSAAPLEVMLDEVHVYFNKKLK